jgi:hypothetical protein
MTTIAMIRTLSGLSPADDHARRILAKIEQGKTVNVEWKQPRNGPMHRKYWALCQMVYDNVEGYGSAEQVSDMLKLLAGHCTSVASKATGEVFLIPKSISFSAMDQGEFLDFWQRVVKAVTEHIMPGVTSTEIENELCKLIGASTWAA